jgi:hypothetical protein
MYEVLDSGEMVVLVEDYAIGSSANGVYLAIFGLAGDFDRDWRLGSPDLAIMLGAWSATNAMEIDLNGDGVVGPADLSILLGRWTGTVRQPLELPCSGEFCLPEESSESMAGGENLDLPEIEGVLQLFGYSNLQEFIDAASGWNDAEAASSCDNIRAALVAAGGES